MLTITILGCGGSSGVPMIGGADGAGNWGVCDSNEGHNRRRRSSILLRNGRTCLLVDIGPDFRQQCLDNRINKIDAVVCTHAHADHIAGLDDLRAFNRIINAPMPIYGTAPTLADLAVRFDYAFRPWDGGEFWRPVLNPIKIEYGRKTIIGDLVVQWFEQYHGNITSLGIRCGPVTYSTDFVDLPQLSMSCLKGTQLWIVGCFQRTPHPAHAWIEKVKQWKYQLDIPRLILTHMGVDMDWAWLQANLPSGVEPAYDGMVLQVV